MGGTGNGILFFIAEQMPGTAVPVIANGPNHMASRIAVDAMICARQGAPLQLLTLISLTIYNSEQTHTLGHLR